MSAFKPFFASSSGELDTNRILYEAIPLAKLIGAVGSVALVPLFLRAILEETAFGLLLTLAAQFVLAVGGSVVLVYVVVRANQIAEE